MAIGKMLWPMGLEFGCLVNQTRMVQAFDTHGPITSPIAPSYIELHPINLSFVAKHLQALQTLRLALEWQCI